MELVIFGIGVKCQKMSLTANHMHLMKFDVDCCKYSLIDVNDCQLMLFNIDCCQLLSIVDICCELLTIVIN